MSIKSAVVKGFYTTVLFAKKNAPTILTISGVALGIGATVAAAVATTHIDEVKAQHEAEMKMITSKRDEIRRGEADESEYTENEAAGDTQVVNLRTAYRYAKLYLPAVALTGLSAACVLSAHHILKGRYTAVASVLVATTAKFNDYRERVIAEYGEDRDREFYNGIETETTVDEKGEVVEETKEQSTTVTLADTQRYFDEYSSVWDNYNHEMNICQLRTIITRAQDILDYKGHLFLNEVYSMLGLPDTPAGAVMGWIKNKKHPDTIVDFGVFNGTDDPWDFVNDEPWDGNMGILLNFNVDGVIYDLI